MIDRRVIGALGIASALVLGVAPQASAGPNNGNFGHITATPEIDAGSGSAAIALLLGALALVGERRRRPPTVA